MRLAKIFSKPTLLLVSVLVLIALVSGALSLYYGVYNVAALAGHTKPVYELLVYARNRAVAVRAPSRPSSFDDMDWRRSGVKLYERHCLKCHGAPGVAPEPFSLGMMPPPSAIVRVARQRSEGELYWVIKNGIKMSGMPAWKYRLTDEELWQLVALLKKLPSMTTAEYAVLRKDIDAGHVSSHTPTFADSDNDISGRVALQQYNCSSCHSISGISSASHYVGPPLTGVTNRSFIAGVLPMGRENLVRWIRDPQRFKSQTTMPDLNVRREHAEAMVDYLETIGGGEMLSEKSSGRHSHKH